MFYYVMHVKDLEEERSDGELISNYQLLVLVLLSCNTN